MAGFGMCGKIEKNWFYGLGGKYISYSLTTKSNTMKISLPANVTVGNLLLLYLVRNTGQVGNYAGWNTLASAAQWNSNTGYSYIGFKYAAPNDPSYYDFNASAGIIVNYSSNKKIYSVAPFAKVTGSSPLVLYKAMGDESLYFVASNGKKPIITPEKSLITYQFTTGSSYFTICFATFPGSLNNTFTRNITTNEFCGTTIGLI